MPQENADTKITLAAPKTVTPAVIVSEVTLQRLVDLPGQKIVRAFVKELPNPITLWEGAAYDEAGDWTQVMAEARLKAKLG